MESEFESSRQQFIENISEHLHTARKSLPKNNPIREQVIAFIDIMEQTKAEWDAKVAGREKGVKFRAGFEDSLLVFVNGKVKSGKSSLGNYMAWGHTDPTAELKNQVPETLAPRFFSHAKSNVQGGDIENEAVKRCEFRVGAIEATSSIQGFSLPGLTWVDSPGMHSLNVENENLAREYVEHADLVLYTVKSDSAGRESDLAEIAHLMNRGKRILLLLTGSDDMEEGVDDDGETLIQTLIMKDQARRARQRDYVLDALKLIRPAQAQEDIDIVSFSARYAQMHADNAEAYNDSGMGEVCETLYEICRSEGVRIKQRTPLNNLSNFLQGCRDGLQPYLALIGGFKQPLEDLRTRSSKRLNVFIQQGQSKLGSFIDDFFEPGTTQRDDAGSMAQQLAAFQKALNAKYQEIATDQLSRIFEEIMNGFKTAVHETYSKSELICLPDFRLEIVTEKIPTVRSGTRKRNSMFGMVFGGVAGFIVGGPAGAAYGASLGGAAGGATGKGASTEYREISVTVGDNWLDIRRNALENSSQAFEAHMRASADHLWELMDKDVEHILASLSGEIGRFDAQLREMLQKTKLKG